jgi:hypothetical protein
MSDPAWILVAVGIALAGFWLGESIRQHLGRSTVGRLVGALAGSLGYCVAVAVWAIQTNDGWHRGRGIEFHSTWAEDGVIFLVAGVAIGFVSFAHSEWKGDMPTRGAVAFPRNYVVEILNREAHASRDECREMARELRREAQRTRQPLPPPLARFVSRHLDRTG